MCAKHPKYRAVQKPRVDCKGCWDMWAVARVRKIAGLTIYRTE